MTTSSTHALVTKLCTLKENLDALRADFEDMQSELNQCTDFPESLSKDSSELADICSDIASELESMYDDLEEALTPEEEDDLQTYTVHMWNDDPDDYEQADIEAHTPEEAEELASEQYNFDHYEAQE